MTYNADCVLVQPEAVPDMDDVLMLDHRQRESDVLRCRLQQMSVTKEALVLGQLALGAYVLRLQTKLPVAAVWAVRVRSDGASEWLDCVVKRVSSFHHIQLMVETT